MVTDVPAPVATYDAVHAARLARTGTAVDGLLLHLARPTADGFQVIEVGRRGSSTGGGRSILS